MTTPAQPARRYAAPIAAFVPATLSPAAAATLLASPAGDDLLLDNLGGVPLVVLDAHGEGVAALACRPALPAVVLAVSGAVPAGPPPRVADIALCPAAGSGRGVPPGWVASADLDAELARVGERVAATPQPAVVLAQLLRAGAGTGVAEGLVLESLAYSTLQSGPAFAAWLAARRQGRRSRTRPEPAETVVVERRGDELMVTLNRPHVHNAVDRRLREQLCDALAVALADETIAAVTLRGNGPSFCSGGDLEEFGTLADPASAHLVRTARSPARLLAALSTRLTAHVHGACVGAGMEFAAFAGTVVATPDSSFRLPELELGLVPGAGGTVSIPRRIGRQRTAYLAVTGRALDASGALAWGLVDDVVAARRSS